MEAINPEESTKDSKKKKAKKQLQWERFRTAFERLQLAWIRTCLTLLMIGVGAYEYFYNRLEAGKAPLFRSSITGRDLGLFLVFTAFFMLLLATIQHLKSMADLKKHVPTTRYSVATILSFLLLALTLFLGVMIFVKL